MKKFIALLLEGMYTGLLAIDVAGNPLNVYGISYLLIILPALLTAALSYFAGLHNFRLMGLFGFSAPGEKKKSTPSYGPQKPKK